MTKRKLAIGFVIVFCLFIIGTSFVLANTDNTISNFFKDKQEKLARLKTDELATEINEIKITYKDYLDYKENLSFIHEMNHEAFQLKPEEILQQMIEYRLVLQTAEESGITVTEAEVREYALEIQKAVEESGDANMQKIALEQSKELGVDPKDLYTHPDILTRYQEMLLFTKFIDQLYEKEELNDNYSYEDYLADILKENKAGIKNLSRDIIKKINALKETVPVVVFPSQEPFCSNYIAM